MTFREFYLEVLKTAFEKLTEHAGSNPEKLKSLWHRPIWSRKAATRSLLRPGQL